MKKRNKIIALMLGAVMTVSMASTSMAATVKIAQTTKTQQTATETVAKDAGKTAENKKNDKKEEKEIFGKIKKIDKDTIEIETAEQEKADTKAGSKTTVEKNADTEKEETVKLVLDGKTTKVTVEKDTRFVCEADKEDKADSKAEKTESKEDTASAKTVKKTVEKKSNTKNIEQEKEDKKTAAVEKTIKLADLKAGDIVKITMDGDKVTEIKKLTTAEIEEKKAEITKVAAATKKEDNKKAK